jgi:AcrR family transcriptional regulator
MNAKLPLRARKKAKVREALIATSFRLFSKKGYTETTLEEICEQCDVTVQTLLRYFGSKDDLLFANHASILEKFRAGLVRATKKGASVEYWVKFLHSNTLDIAADREVERTYRIIIGAPALLARFYAIARQYQNLLEQALSEEHGAKPGDDLHSTLFAHLIVMGPIEAALRVVARGGTREIVECCDNVAKYVLENFRRPGAERSRASGRLSARKATPRARKFERRRPLQPARS